MEIPPLRAGARDAQLGAGTASAGVSGSGSGSGARIGTPAAA
jgi:hypothetical protein